MVIWTPFARSIMRVNSYCAEEPDSYYNNYDLFALRTKLLPMLHDYLESIQLPNPKSVDVQLVSRISGDLMRITVEPVIASQTIELTNEQESEIQKMVDKLTGFDRKFCLVFTIGEPIYLENSIENSTFIPVDWISQMIQFVEVPNEVNPYLNPYGILADLRDYPEYPDIRDRIMLSIMDQLRVMYWNGYVVGAESIADSWSLEPVDVDGVLYRPTWSDDRFAPNLVEFLSDRMAGEQWIRITIDDDYVTRHSVADTLTKQGVSFMFSGNKVLLEALDLATAQRLSAIVESAERNAQGKVMNIATMESEAQLLISASQRVVQDQGDCVMYRMLKQGQPLMISCGLPLNADILLTGIRARRMAEPVLMESQQQLGSKLERQV